MFNTYVFQQDEKEDLAAGKLVKKISVVSPAFEEEEVIRDFHQELTKVLSLLSQNFTYEIIIVDDGSKDRTLPVLREISGVDSRLFFISLSKNFGHQAAITAGLEKATGDLVIIMDSDLQHPPGLILEMISHWQNGSDIVLSRREGWQNAFSLKGILRSIFFRVIGKQVEVLGQSYSDYRLLSRRALDSLLKFKETHRYLRGLISLLGYPTSVVSFKPADRFAGKSKFGFAKLFRYAVDALFSFSSAPSKLIYVLSGVFFVSSLAILLMFAMAFFTGWKQGQSPLCGVTAILLFCSSAILFGQGIVADYVGRVYEQVKNRPLYFIKETNIRS